MENTKRTKHIVVDFGNILSDFVHSITVYNPATSMSTFSIYNQDKKLLFRKIMAKQSVEFIEDITDIKGISFETLIFEIRTGDEVKFIVDKIDIYTIFFEESYGLNYGILVDESKCILYDAQYNEHGFFKINNL